jgi:hypothetical protein
MFDNIFKAISKENPLAHMMTVINAVGHLGELFSEQYMKDNDLKDAAIDSLAQYLMSLKNQK